MVPGFDLFLANALRRQHSRTGRVRSAGRLLQVIVERLHRVLQLRVVEEPGEELGVTLRELDGEAGCEAGGGALAATRRGSGGRLHVGAGRAEADDMDVGEHSLAPALGRPCTPLADKTVRAPDAMTVM